MRIAMLLGSLNDGSTNAMALEVVATSADAAGGAVERIAGLADLPPFVPSMADDAPGPVHRFRSQLAEADALVIAAPEYAAGLAGSVKNALDWLVGSATLYQKVVGVMSVGTTGGVYAIEQMVRTLSWQGAYVVATLGIAAPRSRMTADGRGYDSPTVQAIAAFTGEVMRASRGDAEDRRRAVAGVVTRHGIDPARFGDFR